MERNPQVLDSDAEDEEKQGDSHEHIFDDKAKRQKLRKKMSRLSPRRKANASIEFHATTTTTLPFYQNIAPEQALKNLFGWFNTDTAAAAAATASEDDGKHDPTSINEMTITHEDFNRLRKCVGKQTVSKEEWTRAGEELGVPSPEKEPRLNFKALFGPPPFFGDPDVQNIVHEVMKTEEFLHFAEILVSRFGVESASSSATKSPSDSTYLIGLEQLQDMQRASSADTVFEQSEWTELCVKLSLPETTNFLSWLQFSEAFSVSVKGKRICTPHKDPAAAVYAVLANDKVLETIKDTDDDQVSQKAFTNLLRVKNKKVDDDVWLDLLQNMQTTYKYRQQTYRRKSSFADARPGDAKSGHGYEQPLVVIRNTRNQVLSYEIVFDELGDIGLELQSDFLGQCVTVAKTDGQAARHSIIQKHDIVAAVNGTNLTHDTMALDSANEKERLEKAKKLLNDNDVRKVTFLRQESYYQYNPEENVIHLYLKTIERVPQDGKLRIYLPSESSWKPISISAMTDASSLKVDFEIPKHSDFEQATISWKDATQVIEIALDGETAIGENSTLVLKVSGIDCGSQIALGPCELSVGEETVSEEEEQASACTVTLYSNWHTREGALGNPIRDRVRRAGEYFDSSLVPLGKDFQREDSGLTLESDFFGQCPVVTTVRRSSQGERLGVQQHDILASITSIGGDDGKTLNQLNCIKPFSLSKQDAAAHIKEVRKHLAACHTSGRPYHLEFLRLNSYFFHENGRTVFTFHALTSLLERTSLLIKLPNTKWSVSGSLVASVMDPPGVKVREIVWDSQQHAVHLTLENCSIPQSAMVVVEMLGVEPPSKSKGVFGGSKGVRCAGPGEVVGVYSGSDESDGSAPEMEFVLHEHWHSFIVGHQGIEATKISETLKKFKTSPAELWKVLEYTSLLFDMCKSPTSEVLSFADMNKLIGLVCGEEEAMDLPKWNALCRALGAAAQVGLTRRQFACCWDDVMGLTKHSAKDVYLDIKTAEKLFKEIISVFQANEERQDVITKETISKLASIGGFSETKALKLLEEEGRAGWDSDLFCQIMRGSVREVKFEDSPVNLWIKLFYAKKLFNVYGVKHKTRRRDEDTKSADVMRKESFVKLFADAKITKPKLTNEVWTKVCESVDLDETSGFSFDRFLEVYSRKPLGPRDPLADYYRIETFKMLPERQAKTPEATKEAVLSVAPEKVDVKKIAKDALKETVSAEDVFEDLLKQGLEFSKLVKVKEEDKTAEFRFVCNFAVKQRSRSKGFFHLKIGGISELTDHVTTADREFNKEKNPEELYVMFEITDKEGLKGRMPKAKKKGSCTKAREFLFGTDDTGSIYVVQQDEMWDNGDTQNLMKEIRDAEKRLETCMTGTPDHNAAFAKLSTLMSRLTPPNTAAAEGDKTFNGRIFSSQRSRDPSLPAVMLFPDDDFRLYLEMDEIKTRKTCKLLVCKLFKRIGSEVDKCEQEVENAKKAEKAARETHAILQKLVKRQEEHLSYMVARINKANKKPEDDMFIWATIAKLKQKEEDLKEFETEIKKRAKEVADAEEKLGTAKTKMRDKQAKHGEQQQFLPDAKSAPGPGGQKPGETADATATSVQLIGHASFDVDDLLKVLKEDADTTDDVTHFKTANGKDVGVLLLQFEYKCKDLQHDTPSKPLEEIKIAMSGNDKSTVVEKIKDEVAYEYPSHSHLELHWDSDGLEKGDRLCLVRDGDKASLSVPYYQLLWIPNGSDGDESGKQCDWQLPEGYKKQFRDENLISTDDSRKKGTIQLPSSIGLSLPPGSYKLCLIRNDSEKKTRTVLARTRALVVLPDHSNSVHTPFGTTPLIDVKPMHATLQVFAEEDRWVVADALKNQDGFYDQAYRDRIANEQEIAVTKRELKETRAVCEKVKNRKLELDEAQEKIKRLREDLKCLVVERERLEAEQRASPNAGSAARVGRSNGDDDALSVGQEVVLSYRFHGGKPSSQDQIEILPADVVLVADNLRSLILGKLQGNNAEQVEQVRKTMEAELTEVAQLFSLNFASRVCSRIWMLVRMKLSWNANAALSATSDESDNAFVLNECMKAFNTAPPTAKKNFLFVILDLLDEIAARKSDLRIKGDVAVSEETRANFDSIWKVGLRIPVCEKQGQSGCYETTATGVVVGECKTQLKDNFRQGGLYIAKYVRRTDATASDNEVAGEICRFGPFYVKPVEFSFSPSQMYVKLSKLVVRMVTSEQVKLGYKCFGHVVVSFLKYFLGVVNLSFNVSVLAGNFDIGTERFEEIMHSFKLRLLRYYGPIQEALEVIYDFFNPFIKALMEKLDIFDVAEQCVTGFYLYRAFALLFAATFLVYVVVQEDLLLKVQKLHTYMPVNPGKSFQVFLEQVGSLLVIPLYLTIKTCVLFISGAWLEFYNLLELENGLDTFKLYRSTDANCTSESLAKANYGFGIVALVLIVIFLFVCLPLLLLDLYSWVPLTELEKPEKLQELAESFDRGSIKAAVHSNASLVRCGKSCGCCPGCPCRCCRCCKLPKCLQFQGFKVYYYDYTNLPSSELLHKYGVLGLVGMFTYVYMILMFQSMARSLGVLLAWRPRAPHMYKNETDQPISSWRFYDRFCLRFNLAWKVQYIKDKIVMPFVNIVLVTLGLWGEDQWTEFNVEERANLCYLMEPSAEIKQLQMMSLHGKITSLFWLCIPRTMVLAYLAEVLNRGPVFSYFLNKKFLQADIPESERERDPVWRFSSWFKFEGEEDVVYLNDTRFYSTTVKWASSLVEIITLFLVFPSAKGIQDRLLGTALLAAAVSPLLELNQQVIKAYIEYKESVEHFISNNDMFATLSKEKAQDSAKKPTNGSTPRGKKPGDNPPPGGASATPATAASGATSDAPDASNLSNQQAQDDGTVLISGINLESSTLPLGATDPEAKAAAANENAASKTAPDAEGSSKEKAKVEGEAGKPRSAKKSKTRPATAVSKSKSAENKAVGADAATASDATQGGEGDDDDGGSGDDSGIDKIANKVAEKGEELAESAEGVVGEQGAAAMYAAAEMIKPKRQLITLNALPEMSYVVLTDDLDEGEGEITVTWQINAKQRFHAFDAIGMFAAREAGDSKKKRTMSDCICYCLLKQRGVQPFGWKPDSDSAEDLENKLLVRQAKSLHDVAEAGIWNIKTKVFAKEGEQSEEKELLEDAKEKMHAMTSSPKLKPYAKKMSDMLEEEVVHNKLHHVVRNSHPLLDILSAV